MQGTVMTVRGRLLVGIAALLACSALGVSMLAGGAGAADADRATYSCNYRSLTVTQTGNRLDAKGRMKCLGNGVARQVLQTCLMQDRGPRYAKVKCVTHARNGPGLVTGTAARRCARGPEVGFITKIRIRVRLKGGQVQTAQSQSSDNEFLRNCRG